MYLKVCMTYISYLSSMQPLAREKLIRSPLPHQGPSFLLFISCMRHFFFSTCSTCSGLLDGVGRESSDSVLAPSYLRSIGLLLGGGIGVCVLVVGAWLLYLSCRSRGKKIKQKKRWRDR